MYRDQQARGKESLSYAHAPQQTNKSLKSAPDFCLKGREDHHHTCIALALTVGEICLVVVGLSLSEKTDSRRGSIQFPTQDFSASNVLEWNIEYISCLTKYEYDYHFIIKFYSSRWFTVGAYWSTVQQWVATNWTLSKSWLPFNALIHRISSCFGHKEFLP